MATVKGALLPLFDDMVRQTDILTMGIEPEFVAFVRSVEDARQRWQGVETELGRCRQALAKTETERAALDVKLKHARNQVDVEIKRRQKAEVACERLDRQIQLIRELLLVQDSSCSLQLSEEQRNALAFLNTRTSSGLAPKAHRLTRIDESSNSILSASDISYDRTDDDLDTDASVLRSGRRGDKRKSPRLHHAETPPVPAKRSCMISEEAKGNESIIATTTVTVPQHGGTIEAVSTIETVTRPSRRRSSRGRRLSAVNGEPNVMSVAMPPSGAGDGTPRNLRQHDFVQKTSIKPEACVPCGRRIRFGKMVLRCRECRTAAHPECRDRCPLPCAPAVPSTPLTLAEGTVADFAPSTAPMIPMLVIRCVGEIEQKGMHETGIYRVPGCDRTVKELKERFVRSRGTVPVLSKVEDVHVVCGLLKDFLRSLKEPLLTFALNGTFMAAAEIPDEDNSVAAMFQAIDELPQANRDTLAFLMLHLQKVAQSSDCKMDAYNLARVFGPTLVGHATADPSPMVMLQDTRRQPAVIERLLSLSPDYWSKFVSAGDSRRPDDAYGTPDQRTPIGSSMLGPLTTPEMAHGPTPSKTPSTSSLSQRFRSTLTPKFGSRAKTPSVTSLKKTGNYFESPLLK
ncbi:rac GTPase-activating protein 1 [Petromyzon marinus]|uniref:Rac GTPase-activating protein 1 n=1 Tax=Petromyzon marinus TaxID=7757 RepID=A0AAJ7U848_PETMA|nr:rac GTPase-activating protein 1 [Petromyzon marinus]XP_032831485.1 rac GTPase-activating protein 1 [Petromyzon marinus]XP_032831486.1 rac GTPase-activating protein 1 [Petromyzon marinus]XP_032831487.1 rac GTPase-activating protein 1 [Petromyzon marinus]XP_032831488.1 rac GTPase-activating protein 1 [Petromyzon marinus]XP_032831489.1 rac GTPase-activating protein 1 [Petromyzon marinus]